ncbi:MAG: twin-arginine translocase subunit TatC [Candidatus Mcinerneyibacterium aminivorans]|uniref:Sec-independent protein translocase protein TatC n=1 Tax=Candidatus Mcinerneyibacterium aminivorans TaxID=2703815 RepID=A0A5D0MJG7_9BACT|nr:MAG: twin-arginine translocase subunit TatC [Candidatus Mcinerneyibacterium aminivorans]
MRKDLNFFDHLEIFRKKVIFSLFFLIFFFIIAFIFRNYLIEIISQPFAKSNLPSLNFYFFKIYEKFLAYMKFSFYISLLLTIPITAALLLSFIYPALYKKEKKEFLMISFFSPLLYFFSIYFVYNFLAPFTIKFFMSFSSQDDIKPLLNFSSYIDLIFVLIIILAFCFQIPILLLFLVKLDIISYKYLKSIRKYAIIGIFLIAALFTPPDIISQIIVGIILYLLFELTVFISKFVKNTGGDSHEKES